MSEEVYVVKNLDSNYYVKEYDTPIGTLMSKTLNKAKNYSHQEAMNIASQYSKWEVKALKEEKSECHVVSLEEAEIVIYNGDLHTVISYTPNYNSHIPIKGYFVLFNDKSEEILTVSNTKCDLPLVDNDSTIQYFRGL